MKTTFNTETGVKTWHLDKWYEKTIYISGYIFVIFFTIGFVAGVLENM
jgi:hypothetical protein